MYYSTAGVNLGRFIQTIRCSSNDQTFCFLNSSILVQCELCGGVLVATLPMLGPLFHRRRSEPTKPSGQIQPPGSTPYGRLPSFGSIPLRAKKTKNFSDISDDSLLRTQNDTNVTEWQPQSLPATFGPQSKIGNETGMYWSTTTIEGHYMADRTHGNSFMPTRGIMRKTEYMIK